MNNSTFPIARKNGLVVQTVPDEVLIFDTESNKAHCLNNTAAIIWQSCDGTNSVSQIVKELETRTGKSASDDVVWLAIDQLNDKRLLESGVEKRFEGTSRRDVIKKIGLASMIAIPVVASLVAPQNALAAVSCTCGTSAECMGAGFDMCASMSCCNTAGTCAPALAAIPGVPPCS